MYSLFLKNFCNINFFGDPWIMISLIGRLFPWRSVLKWRQFRYLIFSSSSDNARKCMKFSVLAWGILTDLIVFKFRQKEVNALLYSSECTREWKKVRTEAHSLTGHAQGFKKSCTRSNRGVATHFGWQKTLPKMRNKNMVVIFIIIFSLFLCSSIACKNFLVLEFRLLISLPFKNNLEPLSSIWRWAGD